MIEVKIRLFGALRDYGDDREIKLKVPASSSVCQLRASLLSHIQCFHPQFAEPHLVMDSAFAIESEILQDSFQIESDCRLAILPPVCGG